MAAEVFEPDYYFLPPSDKLKSRLNRETKVDRIEAKGSATTERSSATTTPTKTSSAPRESTSTPTNSTSTPTNSTPISAKYNSALTKSNSTPAESNSTPAKSNSTPAKSNSTPVKTDSPVTGNSQVVIESHSTPPKNFLTPIQNTSMETKSSPGIVGNSDPPEPSDTPLFYANYIHDLESIWWILLWVLLKFQKAGYDEFTEDYQTKIERRIHAAARLFHENLNWSGRVDILNLTSMFMELMYKIPDSFKGLVQVASIFRDKLLSAYKKKERKGVFPIKLKDNGLLHQDVLEAFRTSPIEYFDVVHINEVYPITSDTSDENSRSSKRSINEGSEDERPSKRARQEFIDFPFVQLI